MLSETTLKYLRRYMKGGARLRISVFVWDKKAGEFGITKSKLTWAMVIGIQLYLLMQFFFEVCQLYRFSGDPTEPLPNYMKLLSQCVTRFLGTLVNVDVCLYGKNKAAFLNQIVLLNKRFKSVEGGDKLKDGVKTLARAINFFAFIYPVLVVSDFVQEYHHSRYWHALVIPGSILPFTLPFFGLVEYIITAISFHPGLLYLYLMTIYFRSSSVWLGLVMKLGRTRAEEWKTNRLAMFRTLQVYNKIYNNRLAGVWTYQMAGLFIIQTVTTVISLRVAFHMQFPANCMFFLGAITCAFFTTKVYTATMVACTMSEDFAHELKKSGDKYKQVVGESMRPLQVEVRPFFVMTKTTAFAYTNEVVDKTISYLVTT